MTTDRRRDSDERADATDVLVAGTTSDVLALRTEVGQLKAGTASLAEQVSTLSGALTAVGNLQERQLTVEEQAREARQVAEKNHESISHLDAVVVPREEIARYRRRTAVIGTTLVVVFALLLGLLGLLLHQRDRDQQKLVDTLVATCETRNQGSREAFDSAQRQAALFRGLLARQDATGVPANDPNRQLFTAYLNALPTKAAVLDCATYARSQAG